MEKLKEWEKRIETVKTALFKIEEAEKTLEWATSELRTFSALKQELESLSSFYSFLLSTQTPILSPGLGYFSVLPIEVISSILPYLDAKSLCNLTCVCKDFKTWADDERLWQEIWRQVHPLLKLPQDYPITKPSHKTYKWIVQSKQNVFKEGQNKDGVGTFVYPTKENTNQIPKAHENKYSGDWKNDKRDGYGTFYWCNGSWYIGEWVEDKREGFGTRVWPNGNKYVGQYKSHKRHGDGEFTFSNGSVFKGKFEENKFIFGTYTWPNKRVYNGEWNNIFRHGKGTYEWPDGRSYQGEWKNDKRHGHGVYKWPDGDVFEGSFVDGKRWGKGALRRANGEVYDQEWKEGKFEEYNKGVEDEGSEVDTDAPRQSYSKKRKQPESTITESNENNNNSGNNSGNEDNMSQDFTPNKHHKVREEEQ